AGANLHHPRAQRARACGLRLPRGAHLREEVSPRRRVLVQRLLAVVAVVADRRGADERSRARLAGLEALDEIARTGHAALADRALRARAPALGDALAGQIDDRVPSLQRRRGGRFARRLPAERLHGLQPRLAQPVAGTPGV